MGSATILTLRALLALSLIGSLWVQLLVLPALWGDLATVPIGLRVTVIMILALWLVCLQVVALCIWRLVSMAAADAVFSAGAFRFVDAVIGAIAVAAILTGVLATLMAPGPAAPGVVGIVYGAALATGGVALVVVVMRSLLRKAIEMRSELDEVV
ncbi:DUF2975 domain-containing protein [Microbacterium aquilitoris]|uniref:DUF2975 domain-containing protein n=1 Tax=Microbacterium aquilitoris TaxID=3067307 RepID=A0ABU3GKK9_9MICO|nr:MULTISPECIES: DUF2975 domain-containing protein [unclassified Microbacterium]MDT3331240.1 DUF2975 domain-containing protein [Microbacterium sp. KSW-18]MDT3343985.1 DUF2975 domain-containing protein [Microbacterium sp. KSW2-22]